MCEYSNFIEKTINYLKFSLCYVFLLSQSTIRVCGADPRRF